MPARAKEKRIDPRNEMRNVVDGIGNIIDVERSLVARVPILSIVTLRMLNHFVSNKTDAS